jgi:urease accessory protein
MVTVGPMATATDLLTLAQWFSPSYPVGSYAYSHGMEWAIDSGQVSDVESATSWIEDVLNFGAGRSDAIALRLSYACSDAAEVNAIDANIRAFAPSSERLKETVLQGKAFAQITSSLHGHDLDDLTYPVAVGQAARQAGISIDMTVQYFLHAFVSNLAAVAMRRVPVGQTEGQGIVKSLASDCVAIAEETKNASLDDISSSVFFPDIASMKHETQYSRIFRT